jgi:RHS repeat-associated protein
MQTCTTLTILQRFGIGGARQHPATKLVDLRNRVYATHLRGFLTKDPMGSIDSDGLYNYVAGDPVNLRDPWGMEAAAGDPVGPELDPESIPAEGSGREMVVQRQRCDAECKATRERERERGRSITEREQSRSDRLVAATVVTGSVAVAPSVAATGLRAAATSIASTGGTGNVAGTSLAWTMPSVTTATATVPWWGFGFLMRLSGFAAGVWLGVTTVGELNPRATEFGRQPPHPSRKYDTRIGPVGDPPQLNPRMEAGGRIKNRIRPAKAVGTRRHRPRTSAA